MPARRRTFPSSKPKSRSSGGNKPSPSAGGNKPGPAAGGNKPGPLPPTSGGDLMAFGDTAMGGPRSNWRAFKQTFGGPGSDAWMQFMNQLGPEQFVQLRNQFMTPAQPYGGTNPLAYQNQNAGPMSPTAPPPIGGNMGAPGGPGSPQTSPPLTPKQIKKAAKKTVGSGGGGMPAPPPGGGPDAAQGGGGIPVLGGDGFNPMNTPSTPSTPFGGGFTPMNSGPDGGNKPGGFGGSGFLPGQSGSSGGGGFNPIDFGNRDPGGSGPPPGAMPGVMGGGSFSGGGGAGNSTAPTAPPSGGQDPNIFSSR